MAAAPQHIRRPEHDVLPCRSRLARHRHNLRKLGNQRAQAAIKAPVFERLLVMGEPDDARCFRRHRDPPHGRRHLGRSLSHLLQKVKKGVVREPRPLGIFPDLFAVAALLVDLLEMVVECEEIDFPRSHPVAKLVHRTQIVGLDAQMQARVHDEAAFQRLQRIHQRHQRAAPAQSRLPRPCDRVVSRGDAVGGHLSVGVQQRHVEREMDARARHDLAFEGVTVDIHDSRQDQKPGGVENLASTAAAGRNAPVGDGKIAPLEAAFRRQDLSAGDRQQAPAASLKRASAWMRSSTDSTR